MYDFMLSAILSSCVETQSFMYMSRNLPLGKIKAQVALLRTHERSYSVTKPGIEFFGIHLEEDSLSREDLKARSDSCRPLLLQ
jgi:hypothetical protein